MNPIYFTFTPISFNPAPKYATCRKFRKGDIVRLKEHNGRKPYDFLHKQTINHFGVKLNTVSENEIDSGHVDIFQDTHMGELTVRVHASHLELVIPVEERKPYFVSTNIDCSTCTIFKKQGKKKLVHSAYYFSHGNGCSNALMGINEAQALAQAECDRLNAAYRKEMEQ